MSNWTLFPPGEGLNPSPSTRAPLQDASHRANQAPVHPVAASKPKPKPESTRTRRAEAVTQKFLEEWIEEMRAAGTLSGMANPFPPTNASASGGNAPSSKPLAGPSQTASSSSAGGSRKRKQPATTSLDEDIAAYKQDLSHIDTMGMRIDQNCNQVRRRINQVLDSGIFKKGEFCNAIGSSSNSLNRFLGQSGTMQGSQSEAYENAWAWFKQREIAGLKMPDVKKRQAAEAAKKAKTGRGATAAAAATAASSSDSAVPDLSSIHLPGEETGSVPVYDSADEIRKKINAHLKTPGLTQAQFCRDLYAHLKAPTCKGIQPKQLADFRGKKGPLAGCTSTVFYAAYVYFEKMRLAKEKPKSAHRLEMEKAHVGGLDLTNDGRHGYWMLPGETVTIDACGLPHFHQ